MEFSMQNILII